MAGGAGGGRLGPGARTDPRDGAGARGLDGRTRGGWRGAWAGRRRGGRTAAAPVRLPPLAPRGRRTDAGRDRPPGAPARVRRTGALLGRVRAALRAARAVP